MYGQFEQEQFPSFPGATKNSFNGSFFSFDELYVVLLQQ